jgi:hypothetical protein
LSIAANQTKTIKKHKWREVKVKKKDAIANTSKIVDESKMEKEEETSLSNVDVDKNMPTSKAKAASPKKSTVNKAKVKHNNTDKSKERLGKKPKEASEEKESLRERMLRRLNAARFRYEANTRTIKFSVDKLRTFFFIDGCI